MLFPGLKGENECAVAVGIMSFAYDPSGQFSHHVFRGRHKSEIRPAEGHRESERLTFADRNIGAGFCGSLEKSESEGIAAHYGFCTCFMRECVDGSGVLDESVIVRLLDDDACGIVADHLFQLFNIRETVLLRDDLEFVSASERVCPDSRKNKRIDSCGYEDPGSLPVNAHGCGFCCGCCSVIYGCVCDIEPGDIADHRLIFEYGLKNALAYLGLIRCICRYEFFL